MVFTEEELDRARGAEEKLFGRLANSNNRVLHSTKDLSASTNFEEMSFKRCEISGNAGEEVFGAEFANNTFNGSQLTSFTFVNPKINEVDFQYCEFYDFGIVFNTEGQPNREVHGGNFDESLFVNCHFNNVVFRNCNFVGAQFNQCQFEHCDFSMCSLDSTEFHSCTFAKGDWSKLNLEFSLFDDCTINAIVFPITQVPYVFGLKNILDSTNVSFSNDQDAISVDEYKSLLVSLAALFHEREEHFPVANIFAYLNRNEEAATMLFEGVRRNAQIGNYRNVNRLTTLAKDTGVLDRETMIELYCVASVQLNTLNALVAPDAIFHTHSISYLQNARDIQQSCLGGESREGVEVQFALLSKIDSDAQGEIELEFTKVESAIETTGHVFHTTSVQHNSDLIIIVQVVLQLDAFQSTFDSICDGLNQIGYGLAANAIWDIAKASIKYAGIPAGYALFKKKSGSKNKGKHAK